MSGEALTNAHEVSALPATAIEDCVLGRARNVPLRKPAQLWQLQFHCGKPPPAAEPSTRIFKRRQAQPACAGWHQGYFSDWRCTS